MNLKVWQEEGSGQECHPGSGLELDFLLALRVESWHGGSGGGDGGERSLRDTHSCTQHGVASQCLECWAAATALHSCTFETFGRVISPPYILLMKHTLPNTLLSSFFWKQ